MYVRNRQLPASQQIPRSELELDPRITPSTRVALEAESDLLRQQLAFPLEKACLQYRKLADFYTDAVSGHGIRVYAVRWVLIRYKLTYQLAGSPAPYFTVLGHP